MDTGHALPIRGSLVGSATSSGWGCSDHTDSNRALVFSVTKNQKYQHRQSHDRRSCAHAGRHGWDFYRVSSTQFRLHLAFIAQPFNMRELVLLVRTAEELAYGNIRPALVRGSQYGNLRTNDSAGFVRSDVAYHASSRRLMWVSCSTDPVLVGP